MKVLIVIAYGDVGMGGGSTQAAINMMQSMQQYQDLDIHVAYGCGSEGSLTKWCSEHNIKYTSIYGINRYVWPKAKSFVDILKYPMSLFVWWLHFKQSVSQLRRLIKRVKPDIIHANNSVLYCAVKAADKEGVKCLWHIREYADFDFDLFPSKHSFIKKLQRHNTVSISEDINEHFALKDSKKHSVVYDGVMSVKDVVYNRDKEDYFLFVGSVTKNKGVTDMVEAFVKYSKTEEKGELWIVGNCAEDYYKELQTILKAGNCSDRVKFLGFRKDRYQLMQNARALIVPSLFEGFGFITVEGVMNGCIVIGHNVSGTKMIFDTLEGTELPYSSVEEMVDNMKEVMAHAPEYFENRILRAQTLAAANYSTEQYGKSIYNLYRL